MSFIASVVFFFLLAPNSKAKIAGLNPSGRMKFVILECRTTKKRASKYVGTGLRQRSVVLDLSVPELKLRYNGDPDGAVWRVPGSMGSNLDAV